MPGLSALQARVCARRCGSEECKESAHSARGCRGLRRAGEIHKHNTISTLCRSNHPGSSSSSSSSILPSPHNSSSLRHSHQPRDPRDRQKSHLIRCQAFDTAFLPFRTQVKLCNRFSPAAFPTIRLGHPGQFAGNGSGSALVEPAHRTAASLLQSLNAALKTCARCESEAVTPTPLLWGAAFESDSTGSRSRALRSTGAPVRDCDPCLVDDTLRFRVCRFASSQDIHSRSALRRKRRGAAGRSGHHGQRTAAAAAVRPARRGVVHRPCV